MPNPPKTSTTVRFLIGFSGIGEVLCLLTGGVFYFYFRSFQRSFEASGSASEDDARTFASAHDQNACVDEALRRGDVCGADLNIMCHAQNGIFLTRCVEQARPVAGFCEGVPDTSNIMASVAWSLRVCEAHGRPNDQSCNRLMQSLQRSCWRT